MKMKVVFVCLFVFIIYLKERKDRYHKFVGLKCIFHAIISFSKTHIFNWREN